MNSILSESRGSFVGEPDIKAENYYCAVTLMAKRFGPGDAAFLVAHEASSAGFRLGAPLRSTTKDALDAATYLGASGGNKYCGQAAGRSLDWSLAMGDATKVLRITCGLLAGCHAPKRTFALHISAPLL